MQPSCMNFGQFHIDPGPGTWIDAGIWRGRLIKTLTLTFDYDNAVFAVLSVQIGDGIIHGPSSAKRTRNSDKRSGQVHRVAAEAEKRTYLGCSNYTVCPYPGHA